VKIVLRDPPLPLLVIAIILKVPTSKNKAVKAPELHPSNTGGEAPVFLKDHWPTEPWMSRRAPAAGD
jgi:hypothetical protein